MAPQQLSVKGSQRCLSAVRGVADRPRLKVNFLLRQDSVGRHFVQLNHN